MVTETKIDSCFYQGVVKHRRTIPVENSFSYPVFISYIDIDRTDELFPNKFLFSKNKWSWIRFRAADYYQPEYAGQTMRQYVNELLANDDIENPYQVMLLTNLRFAGFVINPISCFYCFNAQQQLTAIIARVTNTPWGEIKNYVLHCDPNKKFQRIKFTKDMHVSPFNPMGMIYDWRNNIPGEKLALHMDCLKENQVHMKATISLKKKEWVKHNQWDLAIRYPLMTFSIAWRIYIQALKLLLKRSPFYSHPNKQQALT